MKRLLLIVLPLLMIVGCGSSKSFIDINHIVRLDNGLEVGRLNKKPLTGKVYGHYGENLDRYYMGYLVDGRKEGRWTYYYDDGQIRYDESYKNGKVHGLQTFYYESGQKKVVSNMFEGVYDGLRNFYYESGQESVEEIWKKGEPISRKKWNEDGTVKE